MLHHIIYTSRATQPFSDAALQDLLQAARSANAAQAITGILVYNNGQFMQLIEGEEAVVTALYEHLLQDTRHAQLFKFADKAIVQRSFAEWSMAFRPITAEHFSSLTGYLAPEQFDWHTAGVGAADELLLTMMKAYLQ